MTDPIAERVRKLGGLTIRSIGHIGCLQRIRDNDAEFVEPSDMLAELREDNQSLAAGLREAHNVCEEHRDIATASLIGMRADETERRARGPGRRGDRLRHPDHWRRERHRASHQPGARYGSRAGA
jgi:starvation-inducible DNA-binding protein